jgi:PIN like domain
VRVLLDECVPKVLRRGLPGHHVRTVAEMNWSGLENGDLLRAMRAGGFEVLLTVDQNLRHQQNVANTGIALLVLVAASNRIADLVPLLPHALTALSSIKPGEVAEIGASP